MQQYRCQPLQDLCYDKPLLCFEQPKQCFDNTLSLSKLQLAEPELECGCQRSWGSYKPSYSCGCSGGLQRESTSAGCFNNRGSANHGWNTRNSYCASGRYSTDRSNRGSYGVGGVWRGQDRCLDFQNNCPKQCGCLKRDICLSCQRPQLECQCLKKRDLCLKCQIPQLECLCYEKQACYEPKLDFDCGCESSQWGLEQYEPKWECESEKKLDLCNICQKPALECGCEKKCLRCYQPKYLCRCSAY